MPPRVTLHEMGGQKGSRVGGLFAGIDHIEPMAQEIQEYLVVRAGKNSFHFHSSGITITFARV